VVVKPSGYILANKGTGSVVNITTLKSDNLTLTKDYLNMNIGMAEDVSASIAPTTQSVYVGDTITNSISVTNGTLESENVNNSNIKVSLGIGGYDITGVRVGQSILSVTFKDGYNRDTVTKTVEVTVLALPTMMSNDKQLIVGEVVGHNYIHTPIDGITNHESLHNHIASIDSNADIKGESRGSAHIISEVTTDCIFAKKADDWAIASVGLENAPIVKGGEAIDAIDFVMHVSEVKGVTNEALIKKGKAFAWSTAEETFNNEVAITSVDKSKLKAEANVDSKEMSTKERVGYPVTYKTANNTAVTVYVKVIDDEKIDDIPKTGNALLGVALMLISLTVSTAYLYRRT